MLIVCPVLPLHWALTCISPIFPNNLDKSEPEPHFTEENREQGRMNLPQARRSHDMRVT